MRLNTLAINFTIAFMLVGSILQAQESNENQRAYELLVENYSLGVDFLADEKYDSALFHLNASLTNYTSLSKNILNEKSWHIPFFIHFNLGETYYSLNIYQDAEKHFLLALQVFPSRDRDEESEIYACQLFNALAQNYDRQEKRGWVQFYANRLKTCDDDFYRSNGYIIETEELLKKEKYTEALVALDSLLYLIENIPDEELYRHQYIIYKIKVLELHDKTFTEEEFLNLIDDTYKEYLSYKNHLESDLRINLLRDLIDYAVKYNSNPNRYQKEVLDILYSAAPTDSYTRLHCISAEAQLLIANQEYEKAEKLIYETIDLDEDHRLTSVDWLASEQQEIFIDLYEKTIQIKWLKLKSGETPESFKDISDLINNYLYFANVYISETNLNSSRLNYLGYFEQSFSNIKEILNYYYVNNGELNKVEDVWRFHERMKSNIFNHLLTEHNQFFEEDILDSLKAQYYALKDSLSIIQNQLFNSKDDEELSEYRYDFNQTIRRLGKLTQESKTSEQPQNTESDLKSIMNYNRRHDCISIQYSISDNYLHTFIITEDSTFIDVQAINKSTLKDLFSRYEEHLKNYDYAHLNRQEFKDRLHNFHTLSYRLYELLLAPYEQYINFKVQIISDPLMRSIPFETLCRNRSLETATYQDLDYAIKKYSFHYHSGSPLNTNINPQSTKRILSIIPDYINNPRYRNLGARTNEYNYFKKSSITSVWTDTIASPSHILEYWRDYDIINFTGHATSETGGLTSPYLLLNHDKRGNDKIFMEDIQYDKINAKLVFLNACSTQDGEQHFTEGLLGLQRAFFLADAKSIISSLWPISDKESSLLIKETYNHINAGHTTDNALRAAKLSFIESRNPILAIPTYWAAQTLHGEIIEADELTNNKSSYTLKYGFLAIITIGLTTAIIFLYRRKGLET